MINYIENNQNFLITKFQLEPLWVSDPNIKMYIQNTRMKFGAKKIVFYTTTTKKKEEKKRII